MDAKMTFYFSTMNSGKSFDLLRAVYDLENNNGFSVLVIKPSVHTRDNNSVKARAGLERKVDFAFNSECNLYKEIEKKNKNKRVDYIYVDEAQFLTYDQAYQLSDIVDYLDIPVFCYGLRTDFQMKLFEGSKALFELADVCLQPSNIGAISRSREKCTHNIRMINDEFVFDGETILNESDIVEYIPVTRKTFKRYRGNK